MAEQWARRPALVLLTYAAVLAALAWALGWHRFVPVLGTWEQFQYFYTFGAAELHMSLEIVPRANTGGQGYPLVDLGYYLTQVVGLSLPGIRLMTNLYALAALAAGVLVFSRWFGLVPALLGVTTAALSTGFLVFANQTLAMVPSLLLCILLVESTQRLERNPLGAWPLVTTGTLVALLLVHYAMGRYFAVGWMMWYAAGRFAAALQAAPTASVAGRLAGRQVLSVFVVLGITIAALVLFNVKNALHLLNPLELFFPSSGDEIEMDFTAMLPTVIGNLPHLGEMVFPFIFDEQGLLPEILTDVRRAPFFDLWHAGFIVLGIVVAIRRTFTRRVIRALPYASLHAILGLTVFLALFSEQLETGSALISARIVGGTFAVAGYITVAILWLQERLAPFGARAGALGFGLWALVIVAAAADLSATRRDMEQRAETRAAIDPATGEFKASPQRKPPYIQEFDFLQARFRALAGRLSAALTCRPLDREIILRLNPRILYSGKNDWINPYIPAHNDVSPTLAVYLADTGLNAGFVVVHGRADRGLKDWGHGYAGPRRVFSGPIHWQDGSFVYRTLQPITQVLKTATGHAAGAVVVTFSETEVVATRTALSRQGRANPQEIAVPTLASIRDLHQARCPASPDPD